MTWASLHLVQLFAIQRDKKFSFSDEVLGATVYLISAIDYSFEDYEIDFFSNTGKKSSTPGSDETFIYFDGKNGDEYMITVGSGFIELHFNERELPSALFSKEDTYVGSWLDEKLVNLLEDVYERFLKE